MSSEKKKNSSYSAPAVDSMLDIIEFMAEHPGSFGPTELSRKLGISTNLVFRVMRRLAERNYAEVSPEGKYKLSTRFFSLGMSLYSNFELRRRARKHLEKLCEETGETAQLQVPDTEGMLVLDSVSPAADFFLQVVPGSRMHYHASAFGKAVLAFMDEKSARNILNRKQPQLTENTLTDYSVIKKEIKKIKTTGISYDNEEYSKGVFCIGAPVFDALGNVSAGAGMTGMSSRFSPEKLKAFEKNVLDCAQNISNDIGYIGDFFINLKGE